MSKKLSSICSKHFGLNSPAIHIFFILLLGLLVYSNTFNSPFQWDDKFLIAQNPIVKNLSFFFEPSTAKGQEFYHAFKTRYVGYLSFALNYSFHGLDVFGYHLVNISVHLLNAVLVYILVGLTFRTPFLNASVSRPLPKYIALYSGVFFIAHPVQIEAVTYVFQRLTSLAAFFYLGSLAAYILSRLSDKTPHKCLLYAVSLVTTVLAMLTKEIAFTLPIVILLYEIFFFKGPLGPRLGRLLPLFLTLLIIPCNIIDGNDSGLVEKLNVATGGETGLRWVYFFTELRVVATYIRLLFLPVNQSLYYNFPTYYSFFDHEVFLSFFLHLSILSFGIFLFYFSKKSRPTVRLASFGIFWFYIALSVESSIIPLPMTINEYRIYLPSVGFFITLVSGAAVFIGATANKKLRTGIFACSIILLFIYALATYERNSVWASEVSLWEDTVKKSPLRIRAHKNLAQAYSRADMPEKAEEQYILALDLNPREADVYHALGIMYASRGLNDKAIEYHLIALQLKPAYPEAHKGLADAYRNIGSVDKAVEHYTAALRLKPDYFNAKYNLEILYQKYPSKRHDLMSAP